MLLGTDDDDREDEIYSIRDIETEVSVHSMMSKQVFTIDINESSLKVAQEMKANSIGSIIVTDTDEVVGIITERDLVIKVLAAEIDPAAINAGEIMSSPIITIKPSASTIDAAKLMVKSNIRRLAVMDNGNIVGLITDRDIMAISPGLDTILTNLIEMNREPAFEEREEMDTGICTNCGSFSRDLQLVNGMMLCESCRDSEGYYD
ncbi:putative signal transduction protein with CBS domains [Methanosalsum zhilinae DSM 4017]|uniref:Putative signal transduction protein with CBS domains n=1 Tax=Methanosalsum zhilinae (strain DSM 4017 / NBRC 107636 / OCM 62 / WeN5) TaxID=679901 RepID=F7XMI0_METZD|nr:CBS domain-containing protein [Methanosalsum zhilinae]AEH59903.1 putative signal transduction protein with CBS domains [Methanosalsum zhilinae DSM 4017]